MQEMKSLNGFKLVDVDGRQLIREAEGRANSKISKVSKRITNLENGYGEDLFTTDATSAYQKTVPENALPYAEIENVGEAVTVIKSLGGNLVLSDDAKLYSSPAGTMTVTNLGGGKFQFDGFTSFQGSDYSSEIGTISLQGFLSVPVKAGTYKVTAKFVSEGESHYMDHRIGVLINGNESGLGFIHVTEDTSISIAIGVDTIDNGFDRTVYSFEIFKFDGYENAVENYSELIPEVGSDLKITDLGIGRFQFDGYTVYQDNEYCTFLKVPLKAGTYKFKTTTFIEDRSEGYHDIGFRIEVNGSSSGSGDSVTVTADTTAELLVSIGTGGNGVVGMVMLFELVEKSKITKAVIDTLNVPLGEDNFIAVEPMGTLVFENEGNNAVPSTVTYMLKGE